MTRVTVLLFLAATLMKVPAVPIALGILPALMNILNTYSVIHYEVGIALGGILLILTLPHLPLPRPLPHPCTQGIHPLPIRTAMLQVPLKQVVPKLILQIQLRTVFVYLVGVAGVWTWKVREVIRFCILTRLNSVES